MKNITKQQWTKEVINSDKPVLVDFWATWCVPCSKIAPIVEELAKEYEETVKFVKVDVDQNKDLATKYNVMSIPNLVIFLNGQVLAQSVGAASKESLREYIQMHISTGVSA